MFFFKVHQFFFTLICLGLVVFTSACTSATPASVTNHNDGPASSSTSALTATPATSTPVPPVQTSCPAAGSARAAIMPPLPAGSQGKDQNILYTYTSQNSGFTSILKRYDVTTGKKTDLVQTTVAIAETQISSDGQWVIFTTSDSLRDGGGSDAIQLVRTDGQELQTLYCDPGELLTTALAWSPNQKYLAFNATGIGLYLLDMTNGKLQLLLPYSSGYDYRPMKWANNTDLYVTRFIEKSNSVGVSDGLGGIFPGHNELDLLQNITSVANPQSVNPTQIAIPTIPGASGDECQDFDVSPDNTHLLYSDCHVQITPDPPSNDVLSYNSPSKIASQLLLGGSSNTVYQDTAHGIRFARYITNSTILFVGLNTMTNTNTQGGLWKINTDGSGLTQLVSTQSTVQTQDIILDLGKLNVSGYRPNFSVSPDGNMFALGIEHASSHNTESLLFGSLGGGSTTTFATTDVMNNSNSYSVSLVGWVTL